MATAPSPLVRGTFSQTCLAEILIYVLDQEFSGTLILQSVSGEKSAVYFLRGAPAKARLANDHVNLADVLVDLGLVDRPTGRRTQKRAEELGKTHGEVLLEERVLDETSLYLALREQLSRQVIELGKAAPETQFGLYDVNFLAKWGPPGQWRVKPLPLVWRALVDTVPADKVATIIDKVGDRALHLRFEAPVARYRMAQEETSVVNLLRAKARSVTSLRESGVGSHELVERMVAALVFSRQLEGLSDEREPVGLREPPESPASIPPPSQGRRPTAGPGVARHLTAPRSMTPVSSPALPRSMTPVGSSAPPRSATPSATPAVGGVPTHAAADVTELRAEIERHRSQPAVTFYELLGVTKDADAAAVRACFFQLARRWHPDRLPAALEDLRPFVNKTFARMGEAHQTLTDPVRRAEYDKALENAPADEQEKVIEILEASSAYQRAEIFMKKKDYAAALVQARAAYEGDSAQADYVALYAWLESMQRTSGYEDLIKLLDHAVEIEPLNVRALWYRGQLLKKMGKILPAVRDFRSIIELKPTHVDAQRELRVYEMRRRTDGKGASGRPGASEAKGSNGRSTTGSGVKPRAGESAPKPGLFGRLLKKD